MARINKIETCMFCGGTPCVCNAPAPKAPRPKAEPKAEPKPEAVPPVVEPVSKPGPFTKSGFVHASVVFAEQPAPVIHDERPTAKEEENSELELAIALRNILTVFGDNVATVDRASAIRKIRAAGLAYPVATDGHEWRKRHGR